MLLELPFTYFASVLPEDPTPAELHHVYESLHSRACCAVSEYVAGRPGCDLQMQGGEDGSSPISYNLGLSDRVMAICPRVSEGIQIPSDTGDMIGPVSLNGTLLAGTLLVKSEAEWNALRSDESKFMGVLAAIGIPPAIHNQDGRL